MIAPIFYNPSAQIPLQVAASLILKMTLSATSERRCIPRCGSLASCLTKGQRVVWAPLKVMSLHGRGQKVLYRI